MPIDPGKLNRRITIQQQATTQDSYGEETQNWSDIKSCWAEIHTASSREVYAAAGYVSELSHVITIRYASIPTIKAGMRVAYSNRTFRIQAVDDVNESHESLSLLCQEQ